MVAAGSFPVTEPSQSQVFFSLGEIKPLTTTRRASKSGASLIVLYDLDCRACHSSILSTYIVSAGADYGVLYVPYSPRPSDSAMSTYARVLLAHSETEEWQLIMNYGKKLTQSRNSDPVDDEDSQLSKMSAEILRGFSGSVKVRGTPTFCVTFDGVLAKTCPSLSEADRLLRAKE